MRDNNRSYNGDCICLQRQGPWHGGCPSDGPGGTHPNHQTSALIAVVAPRGRPDQGKPVARRGRKAWSLASCETVRLPETERTVPPLPLETPMRRILALSLALPFTLLATTAA